MKAEKLARCRAYAQAHPGAKGIEVAKAMKVSTYFVEKNWYEIFLAWKIK